MKLQEVQNIEAYTRGFNTGYEMCQKQGSLRSVRRPFVKSLRSRGYGSSFDKGVQDGWQEALLELRQELVRENRQKKREQERQMVERAEQKVERLEQPELWDDGQNVAKSESFEKEDVALEVEMVSDEPMEVYRWTDEEFFDLTGSLGDGDEREEETEIEF